MPNKTWALLQTNTKNVNTTWTLLQKSKKKENTKRAILQKKTKKVNSCCIDSKVTRNEYRLWAKFGEKHTLNTEIDIFFGS